MWQGPRCDSCGGKEPCSWDQYCCSGKCTDIWSDEYNCGECGRKCPAGWLCLNGCCVDPSTEEFE